MRNSVVNRTMVDWTHMTWLCFNGESSVDVQNSKNQEHFLQNRQKTDCKLWPLGALAGWTTWRPNISFIFDHFLKGQRWACVLSAISAEHGLPADQCSWSGDVEEKEQTVTWWASRLLSSSTGRTRLPGWTATAGRQSASGIMTGSCRLFDFCSSLTALLILELISTFSRDGGAN